jgi:hypothetical protein
MISTAVRRAVNRPRMMALGVKPRRARIGGVRAAENGAQDERHGGEKCSHQVPRVLRMTGLAAAAAEDAQIKSGGAATSCRRTC